METAFYATGAALVVVALIIAAIGMRSEGFPSDNALRIGVLLVVFVVVGAGYTAVGASEEEQAAREEEEALVAAEEAEEMEAADEEAAEEEDQAEDVEADTEDIPPSSQANADASLEEGAAVFVDNGCGGCHALADQESVGEIGPSLDVQLVDQDAPYIETAIVDPEADIVEGFGGGIMPDDYGTEIASEDLDALVAYLDEVTSAPTGGGGGGGQGGS